MLKLKKANKIATNIVMLAVLASDVWFSDRALAQAGDRMDFEKTLLGRQELAIIVNTADPLSIRVAEYYKKRRSIPDKNVIRIRFTPDISIMPLMEFKKVKAEVDAATPAHVQAYALTWTRPYRVACMSITTAFADEFDPAYCAEPCGSTKANSYFNSTSRRPYDDHRLRPTMMLAGKNIKEVKKLIDRGVASDATFPRGEAYLVSTSDKLRNIRARFYPEIMRQLKRGPADLHVINADYIERKSRVLFYFTGAKQVNALNTIRFLPGAIGDHLTSGGGALTSSGDQMSSLRWLEAGATGSYGAVVEPCNFSAKFPNPGIVIDHYIRGETLVESYWKSVAWPGEGVFIGEPLAAPYAVRPPAVITNLQ